MQGGIAAQMSWFLSGPDRKDFWLQEIPFPSRRIPEHAFAYWRPVRNYGYGLPIRNWIPGPADVFG